MNRNASQTARILGVAVDQVKKWAWLFKDHLGVHANPSKGIPREFTDSDVLALMHVAMHWEEHPDIENIRAGLNSGDHYEAPRYREILYRNTPLLQDPLDDLDETWRDACVADEHCANLSPILLITQYLSASHQRT
jgi:hypothetical protein